VLFLRLFEREFSAVFEKILSKTAINSGFENVRSATSDRLSAHQESGNQRRTLALAVPVDGRFGHVLKCARAWRPVS